MIIIRHKHQKDYPVKVCHSFKKGDTVKLATVGHSACGDLAIRCDIQVIQGIKREEQCKNCTR